MPTFDQVFLFVLPVIPFALPFGMLWLLVTLLQTGGFWSRGNYIGREETPRLYWTIIAFLIGGTVFILVMLIFPDQVYAGLQSLGILPPISSPVPHSP